jgi:hypothetical protein
VPAIVNPTAPPQFGWAELSINGIHYAVSYQITASDPASGLITLNDDQAGGGPHNFTSGQAVTIDDTYGGLPEGTPFFAHAFSPTVITLHHTKADAITGSNVIPFTVNLAGFLRIITLGVHIYDGVNFRHLFQPPP